MTTTTRPKCDHHDHRPGGGHGGRRRHLHPCLDYTLSQLEDDDSVSVSVDLLWRLRDGIL